MQISINDEVRDMTPEEETEYNRIALASKESRELQDKKNDKIRLTTYLIDSDTDIIHYMERYMIGSLKSSEFADITYARSKARSELELLSSEDLMTDETKQEFQLEQAKENKINEICANSQILITKGVSYNNANYSLNTHDQINLLNLSFIANQGVNVPYHADGELCRMYTPEEFKTIVKLATQLIMYHTTYCNLLKNQITKMTSIEEVNSVSYGMDLDDEHKSILDSIVNSDSSMSETS